MFFQIFLFFGVPSSCFNWAHRWRMQEQEHPLALVSLRNWEHLHSKCWKPPPAFYCVLYPVIIKSHGEVSSFVFEVPKSSAGGTSPSPPRHLLVSLLYFLIHIFIDYLDFFVLLFPQFRAGWLWKQLKKCNQPQRKHFIFLGAPCRILNRHKSLEAQETGLKYSRID